MRPAIPWFAIAWLAVSPRVRVEPHDAYGRLRAELARGPDSIAELLPRLDDELRENFTLVYASGAPDRGVDPLHPRVILFTRDARLLVAFSEGEARDVVDVIHYVDDDRRFELEQHVLPAAQRRSPELAARARDNGHANPASCRRCHGADPRPIFTSYRVWPGFYGSTSDRLISGSQELANYEALLARSRHEDTPLRHLRVPEGSSVSPYAIEQTRAASDGFAPNARLGFALAELQRARIARQLEAAPAYARYRDKLLSGLLACEPMPTTGADRGRLRAAVTAEDRARLAAVHVTDPARAAPLHMAELLHIENLAELDYVSRVLETSRADWSLAPEAGSLALFDGLLTSRLIERDGHIVDFYLKEDLIHELLADAARRDPELAAYYRANAYNLHDRDGTRLDLELARRACPALLARTRALPWPAVPPPAPAVAYRCVRCHEPGGEGPPIPFDSPARLRARLAREPDLAGEVAERTRAEPDERMPLDQPALADAERRELITYIYSLGSSPRSNAASTSSSTLSRPIAATALILPPVR